MPFAQRSKGARCSPARRPPSPSRSPARLDAQGMSATSGSANSQSASERGASAKREKPPRTRLASSGGQLTKRTEQGARRAQARATCSGSEALDLTAKNRKVFQESCAGSCRAKLDMNRNIRPQFNSIFFIVLYPFAYCFLPSSYRSPPWQSATTMTGKSSTSIAAKASGPSSGHASTVYFLMLRAMSAAAPPVAAK